ncbi:hypothetical protein BJ322DRAFT_1100774 [Thelephora terrestris]|uniref:GRAM domain-containing protein n=1 Tax=Thelephora terrestris TaxID=56493 RepID=A0A9P6HC57_9AGAM|nr:hypothetical protein BJ322DRAFT_1100774 [Thelephora terrestris]
MALNWTMINEERNPVPLPFEMNIRVMEGVELSLVIPDSPPSGSTTSGGSGGTKKLKSTGKMWLTDQRVIFISDVSKTGKTAPPFESLSVPLSSMISTSFQQPLLGSNFLAMSISPSPEGGLTDGTKAEVRCSGRLFEFAAALDKTRERAVEAMKNQDLELEDGLPVYSTDGPASAVPGPSTATGGGPDLPPAYS